MARKPSRRKGATRPRHPQDFHATPAEAPAKLLAVEDFAWPIWEPACGQGHLSRALQARGQAVISSDLVDRGFGLAGVDFLTDLPPGYYASIITNPPFADHLAWIRRGLLLLDAGDWREISRGAPAGFALLLPLTYLAGLDRGEIYRARPPAAIWVFSTRILCVQGGAAGQVTGSASVDFMWLVWRRPDLCPPRPRLGWI